MFAWHVVQTSVRRKRQTPVCGDCQTDVTLADTQSFSSCCIVTAPCCRHRSNEAGIKESMRLKDAMRDHAVADVAEAWLQLVARYSGPRPDLASAVLDVVRRYVNWIDIGLVANDRHASVSGF